jgi:hypothetical protein
MDFSQHRHSTLRTTRARWLLALLTGSATLAAGALTAPAASAAIDESCATPQVRETMVSQGLPTYGALARGKSTLVKFFLSSPNGCDPAEQYLTVTGGSLTVENSASSAAVSVGLPSESHGPVSPYASAPSVHSTGNPTFLVKGAELGPVGNGLPYTVTFGGSITYTVTDATGAVPVTSAPRTLDVSAAATVNGPTNPLRLLIVPIGDERRSFDTNFPTDARNHLASAMSTLGRLLPVSDGVGKLSDDGAGIRYDVALSDSLVDVSWHDDDFDPETPEVNWLDGDGGTSSKYCPSGSHFSYISTKLASARETWNRANPDAPASRVLGVLWQGISRGASTDDETRDSADGSCVEGYANVPGTVAWSRIVDPHPGNPAQSSGSIAAMELMHTLGAVPTAETGYHSKNAHADATAPDRAYDVLRRSHIALDKSIMRYFYDAWHDDITLLEPGDWTQASCVLSDNAGDSLTSTACSEPATVGAVASAAADRVHLAGKTDGTPAGTHAHTVVAGSRSIDATDPLSPYQLVYFGPDTNELGRKGVRVHVEQSAHHESTPGLPGNDKERSDVGIFDVAVGAPAGTVEFALVKKGTPDVVLYGRTSDQRPDIRSVQSAPDGAPVRYATGTAVDAFALPAEAALSEDGSLLAWEEEGRGVNVRRTSDRTSTPLFLEGAKDPSFAHTGDRLVYATANGSAIRIVDLDTSPQVPALVGAPHTVYDSPRDAFGAATAPVEGPAFSPSDDRVVFSSEGWQDAELYIASAESTCTLLGAPGCAQLTSVGYAHDPSWAQSPNPAAPDGIIAFTDSTPYDGGSSAAVAVINPAVPALAEDTRSVVENDALAPDWGGGRLAYTAIRRDGGESSVVTVDGLTYGDRRVVTTALGGASLSGDDQLLAYSVEESVPDSELSRSVIYLKRLAAEDGERVVAAQDDRPGDLRLDVLARCQGATFPMLTDVAPSAVDADGATFQVDVETDHLCPGAVLQYDLSDGYQLAEPHLEPVQASGSAAALGVVAPRPDEAFLQHRSVPLAVNARDANGTPVAVSYTISGPGPTQRQGTLGAGERTDLAPFTAPGDYALTTSADGVTATVPFTVLEDQDADGIPATQEDRSTNPCLPADADQDPRTAIVDYDGDFLVGPEELAPCTSAHNTVVDLDANSIHSGSSGSKLTAYVTSSGVDLSQFSASQVAITRIAGHHVRLPALAWSVDSDGRAVAKFDRQAFQAAVTEHGLKGFVPVLIAGSTGTAAFSGIDPTDPTIK